MAQKTFQLREFATILENTRCFSPFRCTSYQGHSRAWNKYLYDRITLEYLHAKDLIIRLVFKTKDGFIELNLENLGNLVISWYHFNAERYWRATRKAIILFQVDRLVGYLFHSESPKHTRNG